MTVVHSNTPNPAEIVKEADIVIAAVGKPELVRGDWLKPGAVVIDVGINAVDVSSPPTQPLFSFIVVAIIEPHEESQQHKVNIY